VIVVSAVRGRVRQALKRLALLGAGLACYLGGVVGVSLVAPQRVVALKETSLLHKPTIVRLP
jgi:hypothetical protein